MIWQILIWIFIIITIVALLFSLSKYSFIKNSKDSYTRKSIYESVYKNGIVTDGRVINKSNFIVAILNILDALISRVNPHQRTISYEFIANDGSKYMGACIAYLWLEPCIFFAINGSKIKVIYNPDDPSVNLVYTDLKNMKYNKEV